MFSSCPVCQISLPFAELERHANSHFLEEEFARDVKLAQEAARDMELAQQVARDMELAQEVARDMVAQQVARDMELAQEVALVSPSSKLWDEQMDYVESPNVQGRTTGASSQNAIDIFDHEKLSSLIALQTKSPFYKVEGGIISWLRRCLELERDNSKSVITGHIDHYQSIVSEDSGWGCGWRNIQILSSHLLMQRQEARDSLFGGSGFVPDIISLQRWLEIAWERGFDAPGSNSFNQKICGSRKWIGTTECAALFRSFGLRARIVDFDSLSSSSPSIAYATGEQEQSNGKRKPEQVYGPMDKFLHKKKHDIVQVCPSEDRKCSQKHPDLASHLQLSSPKKDSDSSNRKKGETKGHQVLVDWIWRYFNGEDCGELDNKGVLIREKTPLYFQHDGHSRTIIGIQMKKGQRRSEYNYSLLVLDPAHRTADLERSLKNNNGWQKLLKRGVHTLKKPQYQLCYVDPGMAHQKEMEELKTIDSIYVKL